MPLLPSAHLSILQRWIQGKSPTPQEYETLTHADLAQKHYAIAFHLTPENGLNEIKQRSQLLSTVYPQIEQCCRQFGLSDTDAILTLLWRLWLPLALLLDTEQQKLHRPLIQGILGGQGTGKTTLGAVLQIILNTLGHTAISISLDDLYKTFEERQQLQQQDPRLIWRGPPATHDVTLGIQLLDQLRQSSYPVSIPRFDKSLHNGAGDRIEPEIVSSGTIILFEGWFVGVHPIADTAFENSPSPINTFDDQQFARENNRRLRQYLPLWERLDRLMVLYPIDYTLSQQWRREAEHKMILQGKPGMTDAEINAFVEYFWRSLHPKLFITPLTQIPGNLIVEINPDHTPGAIYSPT